MRVKTWSKIIILVVLLLCMGFSGLAANEVAEVWARLYGRAATIKQQYGIMQSIVEQHNRDLIPVLQDALAELNLQMKITMNETERRDRIALMKMIVKELGSLKASEAAVEVHEVVKNGEDALLKGEAIITLGKMRATQYVEELSLMLRNLNFFPTGNSREEEIIAYACVLALERMRDISGFRPVFFASLGWYSPQSKVRDVAKRALQTMVDDPTDELKAIIISDSSFSEKQAALEAAVLSKAENRKKTGIAIIALDQALVNVGRTVKENIQLSQIRVTAMSSLINLESHDAAAVPLMEQVVYSAQDLNEVITAINALGTNATDEAVMALSKYLRYNNERMTANINPEDYRPVRATIFALGESGNPLAEEELLMVEHSNWANAIMRDAEEALDKLR